MRPVDWLLLALVLLGVGLAVFCTVRSRKKGKRCCGDCSGCSGCAEKPKNKG